MIRKPQIKVSLNIWGLPIVAGLTLILAVVFNYQGWWMTLLALGLTYGFSFFSIRQFQQSLQIQREMRFGWAKVGDVLEERIVVKNEGALPTAWVEIEDHTNIPGRKQVIGTNISPFSQTSWRTQHVCSRRGLYRLGPTSVHTSDLFGIYQLSIQDPTEVNIIITPPIVPLPQIDVASGGLTGDGRLTHGSIEQSVVVSTVRDYQPKDPLSTIHWPSSAKRGVLTSRVFDNTPTGNWWIIQDMNAEVQVGTEENNSLEAGIILSASLAKKGIQSGKAVGFIANDQKHSWVSAQHSGDQTMKILRTLALCETGDLSLNVTLKRSRGSFQQSASIIIITPDISLDWWASLLWLKAKGMIPTVLLLNPKSFGGFGTTDAALRQLRNAGVHGYSIQADMFADQINIDQKPLWEWRVFGTGHAVPVKKPKDADWKSLA